MGRWWPDDEIVNLLRDRGPDTAQGLATYTGRDSKNFGARLNRLATEGRVYVLTGTGTSNDPRVWDVV